MARDAARLVSKSCLSPEEMTSLLEWRELGSWIYSPTRVSGELRTSQHCDVSGLTEEQVKELRALRDQTSLMCESLDRARDLATVMRGETRTHDVEDELAAEWGAVFTPYADVNEFKEAIRALKASKTSGPSGRRVEKHSCAVRSNGP